ncbi:Class III cytochrome C family protein [Maridesulfovibrio ferrireducens]|uniref:Class III cytochrome C family protein n=1 Tax=Maridesulfovibrio ferrireducens TaxID=246191 RepID=A0A1G9HH36_9BACT|nr:cytochrome c3 family protein [Maridesulfovibrio ferrireducens]SDL12209.1 Class III cytochrome C family protein [Maridesulfovibrio ferrireducens]
MKSNFLYVGVAVVFAVLVIIYATTTSHLSEEIASISSDKADITNPVLTVSFPVTFEFKRPAELNKTRFSQVKFSHFNHQDVSCVKCHHTWDGKAPVKSCATDGCHNELKAKGETESYFKAFHTLHSDRSCRGCHAEMNKAGKTELKLAPCANNACHVIVPRVAATN